MMEDGYISFLVFMGMEACYTGRMTFLVIHEFFRLWNFVSPLGAEISCVDIGNLFLSLIGAFGSRSLLPRNLILHFNGTCRILGISDVFLFFSSFWDALCNWGWW